MPVQPASPLTETLSDASTKQKKQDEYDIISNYVNVKVNGEIISNIYGINKSMGDYEMKIQKDVFEEWNMEVDKERE